MKGKKYCFVKALGLMRRFVANAWIRLIFVLLGAKGFAQGVGTNISYNVNVDIQVKEDKKEDYEMSHSPKAVRHYREATQAFLGKQYSQALSLLAPVLEKEPNFPEAHYLAGLTYMKLKQYNHAIPHFQQAFKNNETDRNVFYQLALAYKEVGQVDSAWQVVKTGLTRFPEEIPLLYLQGEVAVLKGDYEAARVIYETVLQLESTPIGYYYLGLANEKRNAYEQAKQAYLKAYELDSTFSYALTNLGYLYYLEGDCEKSLFYFDKALALRPEDVFALYYKGMCLHTLDDKESVRQIYEKLLKLDPQAANRFQQIVGER
jgi:tetratricopeptide (TPR) repeat protein